MCDYSEDKLYYAIFRYNRYTGKKEYLGYQSRPYGKYWENYRFMSRDGYQLNMGNHDYAAHPTYFRSRKSAEGIAKVYKRNSSVPEELHVAIIPKSWIPSCGWECSKCNKKKKGECHRLKYRRQNICGFVMAKIPDEYKVDPKRLDAPCDVCKSKECYHYQGH